MPDLVHYTVEHYWDVDNWGPDHGSTAQEELNHYNLYTPEKASQRRIVRYVGEVVVAAENQS